MRKILFLLMFALTAILFATQINVVGEVFTETW